MAKSILSKIPEIDISPFIYNGSTKKEKNTVITKIADACEKSGFFIITGHGIPQELVEGICTVAKEFFNLSLKEKESMKGCGSGSGYIPMGGENLAATLGENAPVDLKESFNISSREEKNKWPESSNFKNICMDYFETMTQLASVIMEIFALALKLPEKYFDEYIKPPCTILRLLNYPEQSSPPKKGQLRAAEHTDYGTLTIVWSDSPGLQVKSDNESWIDVNAPAHAFVINIGDIMQRWTNDKWKSTLHRVTSPAVDDTNPRQSIVFFHNPHDDAKISCLDTCCSDDNPARYGEITAGDHRREKSKKSREHTST